MSSAIEVRDLGKKFCPPFRRSLAYAMQDIFKALLFGRSDAQSLRPGEVWALQKLGFTARRGEALAVIGHNGAGKSTLLKILSGLLAPDTGSVRVNGKIAALIELGAGMNPLQTARQNVILVALLHGLSRTEARSIVPDVLSFAELEHVADVVVQSFSTGMRARLSFAIAAMMRPDVFLVDEVLAVGDLPFQRKCISHMQRFVTAGGTLILVSHALHQVQAICERAILLDRGEIIAVGETSQIVRRYLELEFRERWNEAGGRDSSALLRVDSVELRQPSGNAARTGEPAMLRMCIDAREPLIAYCGIAISTEDGTTTITSSYGENAYSFAVGRYTIECIISHLPLVAGCYLVRPILADSTALHQIPLAGCAAGGTPFEVKGPANLFTNNQVRTRQVVAIEAAWSCREVQLQSADALASELP